MNKFILTTLFSSIIFSSVLFPAISFAEEMYVDDTLLVPLRSGEGNSFRIVHRGIKSGAKLEILGQNPETGYSKVKTQGGLEGYLPTRYLSSTPIAKILLVNVRKNLSLLKVENSKLKTKFAATSKEYKALIKNNKQTSTQLNKNNKELANIKSISADALNLDRRNREFRELNEQLRNELELLNTENIRLKDKSDSNMLLIGGGLIVLGALLALIIPTIKPSKKNDSWA